MTQIIYIAHPDVVKDPRVPVPRWPLSARGRARMAQMLSRPWVRAVGAVFCSDEQKALDGAAILANFLGIEYTIVPELGEVDRSSTGWLPEEEHAEAARRLFERPDERVRGWETARQAQDRIVRAVDRVIDLHDGRGDIAIMAHGAVGTFLLCHLKGVPISMAEAQPGRDGGHYFRFEAGTGRLLEGWTRIDPT